MALTNIVPGLEIVDTDGSPAATSTADALLQGVCRLHDGGLDDDLDETLRRVARLAVATLPACNTAEVALTHHGQPVATESSAPAPTAGNVRGRLEVPLTVDGTSIGTLTLHAAATDALREDAPAIAVFAEQAAIALANAATQATLTTLARQLQRAFETRGPIEQAKGILMAQHGCTPGDAFAMLVDRSQRENRKLRLVAGDIVLDAQRV